MLVICSAIAARADGQPAVDRKLSRHAKVMGTVVSLTVWGQDERTVASAARAVFDEFDRVNMLMSSWLEESAVARINSAAGNGKFVQVDKEVMSVIVMSQQASKASKGAFDITVGSFRGLWKFDEDIDGSIPDAKAVKARKKLVNYRDLTVDAKRNRVKLKRKGQRITLGGVAKGYAVDRAVKILRERGVVDFILQAGGDLYVAGKKGAKPWMVGIRDPRGERHASFARIELENKTFSTSGDYERALLKTDDKGNKTRYHHILDPKTGRPATRSRSVTVMADDAITADIWSTALFVMGAQKGMKLVEKKKGVEAVFVDSNNKLHISSGLKKKLTVDRPPSDGV